MKDSQDIETATTAVDSSQAMSAQPDSKTRRYDRQLRLWATSGQNALESARVLVVSASATSTSILKNLVLPGIGRFTLLDPDFVSQEDAGNNFFLEGPDSVGKSRAQEAVRLLRELNESVEGTADTTDIASRLTDSAYLASYNLVIAHNLPTAQLDPLSKLLWADATLPPLITVRSAGFLAEFHIQIHEHTIIDSHPEVAPSLRIDKPFPALLEHARALDLGTMDTTDHGHIPYAVILVRALDAWKEMVRVLPSNAELHTDLTIKIQHDGRPPQTSEERSAFKKSISALKRKSDEENFDEAVAQAYRAWSETRVPFDIAQLFDDPALTTLSPTSPLFFHLLATLKTFTEQPPCTLPLSAALPDMKADTTSYVQLQRLYKTRAEEEKVRFAEILRKRGVQVDSAMLDEFVRNAHGLKIVRGNRWGTLDLDPRTLANLLSSDETAKIAAIHLALSAVSHLNSSSQGPTKEQLTAYVQAVLPSGIVLPEDVAIAVGEVARTPTADLPNTAAFLGGLVAQEAIKVITKQYVPVQGTCVIDLIASRTGILQLNA